MMDKPSKRQGTGRSGSSFHLPSLYSDSNMRTLISQTVGRAPPPGQRITPSIINLPKIGSGSLPPRRPMTGLIPNNVYKHPNFLLHPYIRSSKNFDVPIPTARNRCSTANPLGSTPTSTHGLGSLYDRLSRINMSSGSNVTSSPYQNKAKINTQKNKLKPVASKPTTSQYSGHERQKVKSPHQIDPFDAHLENQNMDSSTENILLSERNSCSSCSTDMTQVTVIPARTFRKHTRHAPTTPVMTDDDDPPYFKPSDENNAKKLRSERRPYKPKKKLKTKKVIKVEEENDPPASCNSNNTLSQASASITNQKDESNRHRFYKNRSSGDLTEYQQPSSQIDSNIVKELPSEIYQKLQDIGIGIDKKLPVTRSPRDRSEILTRLRKAYAILQEELDELNVNEDQIMAKGIHYDEFIERQKRELDSVRNFSPSDPLLIKEKLKLPKIKGPTPLHGNPQQIRKMLILPKLDIPLPSGKGSRGPMLAKRFSTDLPDGFQNDTTITKNIIKVLGRPSTNLRYSSPAEVIESTVSSVLEGRKRLMKINSLMNSEGNLQRLELENKDNPNKKLALKSVSMENMKMKPSSSKRF